MYRDCCQVSRGHLKKLSEQTGQFLWFPDYIEEIECDFAAIYGIQDMWSLDGPKFVRFASRLPWYEGAVRGKIIRDTTELDENGETVVKRDPNVEKTTKMKMSEAVGQVVKDDFVAMNQESLASGMGDLFERVTV